MMHPKVDIPQSKSFFLRIQAGEQEAFKLAFDVYYRHLVLYAHRFLGDMDLSENIVQNVFVTLWEKRAALQIESIKAYLIVSVRNQCHNEIKHQKVVRDYEARFANAENETIPDFPDPEIMAKINKAINELLEQRRRIFTMNRVDGMRYKEIAEALNISPKTVEVQIGKALKCLRESLASLRGMVYHHN
jgi:RNA polymerase sigma-70 factor (ECF subfamily)